MTSEKHKIETDGVEITLSKVLTPAGERLEVDGDDGATRLDALDCETLTWQDEDFYTELVDGSYDYRTVEPNPRESADLKISNEYTVVRLRVVEGNSAVELTAPKLGYGTQVDACAFAALVEKPKTFFSKLLQTPYGPEE